MREIMSYVAPYSATSILMKKTVYEFVFLSRSVTHIAYVIMSLAHYFAKTTNSKLPLCKISRSSVVHSTPQAPAAPAAPPQPLMIPPLSHPLPAPTSGGPRPGFGSSPRKPRPSLPTPRDVTVWRSSDCGYQGALASVVLVAMATI